MTENLQRAVEVLCEELGLPVPSGENPAVDVDGQVLQITSLPRGEAVLISPLGSVSTIAEERRESVSNLLSRCMTLQGARFAKLGTQETLTLDDGQLVLWSKFQADSVQVSEFLNTAESMLNEAEYWKNWLAAA